MNESQAIIQHFILTRFNLLLWNRNKNGSKVRTKRWLTHRFSIFEKYCLPSVKNQSVQDFEWIVLFDDSTPNSFKARIAEYQKECRQFIPIFVAPEKGHEYALIFKEQIVKRLHAKRVLTTYLDNDDALNKLYVEDLRSRVSTLNNGTFIYYDKGYQLFADHKYLMQINYPKNHFVSYVECGDPTSIKSVFGFGGHYYISTLKGVKIEHVDYNPMWCEVLHETNMLNDAYFLKSAKMVHDENRLRNEFNVDETIRFGVEIYVLRFLPRYLKTLCRRTKWFLFGREL